MDKETLIEIIKTNLTKASSNIVILEYISEYLTDRFKNLILANNIADKFEKPYYRIIVKSDIQTNNYLSVDVSLNLYPSEFALISNYPSNIICVNINELFYNCSTVCINRYNCPYGMYSKHNDNDFFKNTVTRILFELYIELCKMFKYSNIIYTVSTEENPKLIPILEEYEFKIVQEYKNKRNNHTIRIYSKLI